MVMIETTICIDIQCEVEFSAVDLGIKETVWKKRLLEKYQNSCVRSNYALL